MEKKSYIIFQQKTKIYTLILENEVKTLNYISIKAKWNLTTKKSSTYMLKENLKGLEMCSWSPMKYQNNPLKKASIYDP